MSGGTSAARAGSTEVDRSTAPAARAGVRPLRLAIIGCGAVAEKRYLAAAPAVPEVRITDVVDIDAERAREMAARFGIERHATDHRDVLEGVDAAIVATPPRYHAEVAIDCLTRGVHVLCEKPLATTVSEGERMRDAAHESGVLLSVGMVRRLGRSAGLVRRLVRMGLPGRLQSIDLEEGGAFDWPLRTGGVFREADQGGVLRDTGTHLIDLAAWVLEARPSHVHGYEDDSWGGPEANARIELELDTSSGPVPARIEISFTRELGSRLRVHGDQGTLEGRTLGGAEARFLTAEGAAPIELRDGDGIARTRVEDFRLQLRAFAAAVRRGGPPPVAADEALATLRVIEDCYAGRRRTLREWEREPSGAMEVRDG